MNYIIIFPTWNTFLSIYLSKLILLLMKNLNCNFLWPISVLNISKESLLTISQNLNFYAFHDSICTDGLLKEDINQYCNSFCMRFVGYKVRIEFFLKLLQILCVWSDYDQHHLYRFTFCCKGQYFLSGPYAQVHLSTQHVCLWSIKQPRRAQICQRCKNCEKLFLCWEHGHPATQVLVSC